ncbi:A-kinase-interacting protein 1 [Salminus brasiliensis]|uniref:A-kinase-interacting protein 1 n=1 Tax=Salminus brasiliensis TaxID=930266 RepID=UPI003B834269
MRRPPSMAGQSWLESSLQRSSKLGLEVLERAKRRSVDWPSVRRANRKHSAKEKHAEEYPCIHTSLDLDRAFSRIVQHMSETTYECKNFYESSRSAKVSEQEKSHVCRFHAQRFPSGQPRPAAEASRKAHCAGLSEPEDFLIEVSPGTYSITAAVQDAGPQTRVVHIGAGESKRLAFDL